MYVERMQPYGQIRSMAEWCGVRHTDNKVSAAKSCTDTEQKSGFAVTISVPFSDMIITYKPPFDGVTGFISETSDHQTRRHYAL